MSTAGRLSPRVRTERSMVSATDFGKEVFRLEGSSESCNFLIYGDSNAGKTVLSGTAPGKQFWLVCEPGYKTAQRVAGAVGYGRKVSDTAAAWAAIDWLEEKERYRKFDWIVLDGISTMQDRFRLGYAQEAFDIDSSKRQHRNLPDKPDYFNTQNMLKAWIPRLVDLPVNLIITAHAWRTTKSDDADLIVYPGIQGKVTEVANTISGLMDVTAFMERRRVRSKDGSRSRISRRLYFEPPDHGKGEDVKYIIGDKFNCLGPWMDQPTIPKMMQMIEGKESSDA